MPGSNPKKSYHHGDLRGALIAAAEQLMAQEAAWTFTLREVARAAGVSHNAPYNHFSDRRALLAAVAAHGFDDLTSTLRHSLAEVDTADVAGRLRAVAKAYVAFAVAHPSRYRLMFSAELAGFDDAALRASGERAFMVLHDLIAQGVSAGRLRVDLHGTHALTAWSLVHGLGTLVLDGRVQQIKSQAIAALADAAAGTLVNGLAVPGS